MNLLKRIFFGLTAIFVLLSSSDTSTSKRLAIFINWWTEGWERLVHHLETVMSDFPN